MFRVAVVFTAAIFLMSNDVKGFGDGVCFVKMVPDGNGKMRMVRSGTGCAEGSKKVDDIFADMKQRVTANLHRSKPEVKTTASTSSTTLREDTSSDTGSGFSDIAATKSGNITRPTTPNGATDGIYGTTAAQEVTKSITSISATNEKSTGTQEMSDFDSSTTIAFQQPTIVSSIATTQVTMALKTPEETTEAESTFSTLTASTSETLGSTAADDQATSNVPEQDKMHSPTMETSQGYTTAVTWWMFSGDEESTTVQATATHDVTTAANWWQSSGDYASGGFDVTTHEVAETKEDTTAAEPWLTTNYDHMVSGSGVIPSISCDETGALKYGSGVEGSVQHFTGCEILYCSICFWTVVQRGDWYAAQETCSQNMGSLANIYSGFLFDMIVEKLSQKNASGYFWTGMRFENNKTKLSNGNPSTFVRWSPGQPEHGDPSRNVIDFEVFGFNSSGMWNWSPEDVNDSGFVCELNIAT